MPYLFTCPNCQTRTLVADQYSGHVGRCVTCDRPIEIPQFLDHSPRSQNSPVPPLGLSPNTKRWIAATVCGLLLLGLIGAFYRYGSSAVGSLQTTRQRAVAIRNLEQIAAALNAYAADYGTYPTPVVRDAAGNALHSWRVTILPYLNEQAIFNQYNFDQPWNSTDNYNLVDKMPSVYASTTSSAGWGSYQCNYQLVTGPLTLFPKAGPLGPKQITDDATKTVLVVEALPPSGSTSVWTEPTELDMQLVSGMIGNNPGVELGSVTEGGAAVATVDGRGHFLDETMSPEIVRSLLTATGREPLADDVLD